jgi:hypothetical protein
LGEQVNEIAFSKDGKLLFQTMGEGFIEVLAPNQIADCIILWRT